MEYKKIQEYLASLTVLERDSKQEYCLMAFKIQTLDNFLIKPIMFLFQVLIYERIAISHIVDEYFHTYI